jgi:hypothetical protein
MRSFRPISPHAALRAVLEKYGRLRQLPLQHSLD